MKYDVAVIGAGVVGSLVTRELSKYNIKVALLERCNDCAMGATKANSAIVHAGFDAMPGTLKAKLNVRGVELMKKVCGELNVPLKNNGALVVAFSEDEIPHLEELKKRGEKNGVPDLRVVGKEELAELEPNIGETAVGALVAPTSSIVCPYELTIAAVENAVTNGAQFLRNCEVTGIDYSDGEFKLSTSLGEITAEYVINAAGVHSGEIASLIGDEKSLSVTEIIIFLTNPRELLFRERFSNAPQKWVRAFLFPPPLTEILLWVPLRKILKTATMLPPLPWD